MLKHPSPRDWNRARLDSLFEDGDGRPSPRIERPFRDYLHRTPAAPMSPATRVLLGFAGLVVLLLLGIAIWRTLSQPQDKPRTAPRPRFSLSREAPLVAGKPAPIASSSLVRASIR